MLPFCCWRAVAVALTGLPLREFVDGARAAHSPKRAVACRWRRSRSACWRCSSIRCDGVICGHPSVYRRCAWCASQKEVFTLKELEKICPKRKGIGVWRAVACVLSVCARRAASAVGKSVKEVLQGLVDDYLVETDRIGASNYFWAFPSNDYNTVRRRVGHVRGYPCVVW